MQNFKIPIAVKLPVSGLVICYNEAHLLPECLQSLAFCSEIVVCDLGSKDSSVEIAQKLGARVFQLPWAPIVEKNRAKAFEKCTYHWIVNIDPDEVLEKGAVESIQLNISSNNNIALITFPWIFYFKGNVLRSTRWGFQQKIKPVVFHRLRICLPTQVHQACQVLADFVEVRVKANGNNALKHYWMNSYAELFKKHWRYITMEGESKYIKGERFSWRNLLLEPCIQFKKNYFNMGGLEDGWRGLFLSAFYGMYLFLREISLLIYQIKKRI